MDHQRTAIVTGAGKRIGEQLALALVERGWTVVAHVRPGGSVPDGTKRAEADLADPDCSARIFAAAEGLPPVRLLINNAARFAWDGLGDFRADEFDAHMHVNVRAPVLLIDELARRHSGGDALVINIADSKVAAPNPDFLSYTLSKLALTGLTEVAARALAGKGIRVNAIAPALMLKSAGQSDGNFTAMHDSNPLGRGVSAADVIAAMDYLLAAPTVTGETLVIDSGQRFQPPGRDVQFLEA